MPIDESSPLLGMLPSFWENSPFQPRTPSVLKFKVHLCPIHLWHISWFIVYVYMSIFLTEMNFMSPGSYIVAHFTDSDSLLPAIETLGRSSDVVRWDAVDGNVQVIIKLKPVPAPATPESILNIKGIDHLTYYNILSDHEGERGVDSSLCHSYIFVEADPGKRDIVEQALKNIDAAVSCSTVNGGNEFIVLVEGKNFEFVDAIANGRIRMLDGVLRVKKNRVIELRAM